MEKGRFERETDYIFGDQVKWRWNPAYIFQSLLTILFLALAFVAAFIGPFMAAMAER